MRFFTIFDVTKGIPEAGRYAKLLPFILGIYLLMFTVSGFYRRTRFGRSAFLEALDIIQSSVLGTMAFVAFTYFYDEYRYSRLGLGLFAVLMPLLIIGERSLIRKVLRRRRKRHEPRRILVIGSGDALMRALDVSFHTELQNSRVSAAIAVDGALRPEAVDSALAEAKVPRLDLPADWPEFFSRFPVDCVAIALSFRDYQFLDQHLEAIANQVADIKVLPDLTKFSRFSPGIEMTDGVPIISIHESPLVGWGSVLKRLLDVVGALFGILIFSPVMLVAAGLVRLTSKGPIFYVQERMGLDCKTFRILKFRSMPTDAERESGAVWATATDNRPTRVGAVLRKTNLDELPQFFNVLRGDMSLVGPRPERPVFVDKFRRIVPGYMLRHKVKAGMTGWAQVKGWRGNTSIERRIECDLYYIQNWSIWLDLRILIMTVLKSFIDKNAY
jgi:Undecaprenyl-phosphate glucose phosphotransferase